MSKSILFWFVAILAGWGVLWSPPGRAEDPIGVPLAKLVKVLGSVAVVDRKTGRSTVTIRLRNISKPRRTLYGPFTVVVIATSQPAVTLLETSGTTSDGKAYQVFAAPAAGPRPGKLVLRFNNPERRKFKVLGYAVYGLLAPNQPPVAEAGGNRSAALGEEAYLDGSASTDPDGHPLRYRWTLLGKPPGSAATLSSAETALSRFVPDQPGTYTAQLVVTDRIAESQPDTVSIQVAAVPVNVPDLSGLSRSAAESALAGAGLAVGNVAERSRIFTKSGTVTGQHPLPGVALAPGSAVDFLLVRPPPVKAGEAFPEAWGGRWKIITAWRNAETGAIEWMTERTDDLCTGDPFGLALVEQTVGETLAVAGTACTGEVTTEHASASCSGGITMANCNAELKFSAELRRSGESLTGAGSWTGSNTCGLPTPAGGQTFLITGSRLGPADASACILPGAFVQKFLNNPALLRLGSQP